MILLKAIKIIKNNVKNKKFNNKKNKKIYLINKKLAIRKMIKIKRIINKICKILKLKLNKNNKK